MIVKIGFVGLGLMGLPMVKRLMDAGHHLRIFSHNSGNLETLKHYGAVVTGSISEAADGTDAFARVG